MSDAVCRECGREFKSTTGMKSHHTKKHKSKEYKDCEKLKYLYEDCGLGFGRIGQRFGVSAQAIETAVKNCGIETRKPDHKKPAAYTVVESGHPRWETVHADEHQHVPVHRLLAVCEYGFEAVKGNHVHHKNDIPWDNRPENLEPMTASEHMSHHKKLFDDKKRKEIAKDYLDSGMTGREYVENVSFSRTTLRQMVKEYKNE